MTSIFWTADTNIDRAYRWPRVDRSQDSRWASEGALLDILPLIRGVFRGKWWVTALRMILASKRPLWTALRTQGRHRHTLSEKCPTSRLMHRSKQRLYSITSSVRAMRHGGPQGPKPKRQNTYSASMTTCRTCVKREAPNIATKPSMATSNTVSSVPTIQSNIRRIGAPVILTVKLDRLSSTRPMSFDPIAPALLALC